MRPWTGSAAIRPCGHHCSTSWPGSTSTPAYWANLSCRQTGPRWPRSWAAIRPAPWLRQARAAAQAARRVALPARGTVETEPAGSLRWLAHRRCPVAGEQNGLGQTACAPAVPRRRWHPANNTAVFNVLQDHGMLQPAPDGKAIWRATITSSTGWSHSFTLLRLAPALIWESGERPTPFAGTVAIDAAVAENDAEAPKMPPAAMAKAAPNGQKLPSWEGSSTVTASPPKAQPVSDVMEDMLAMVSTSGSPGAEQDVEPVHREATPQTPALLCQRLPQCFLRHHHLLLNHP